MKVILSDMIRLLLIFERRGIMVRMVVGVAVNLCFVDVEGKNIYLFVFCRFVESIC